VCSHLDHNTHTRAACDSGLRFTTPPQAAAGRKNMQFTFPAMANQVTQRRSPVRRPVDHGRENKRQTRDATEPRHRGDRARVINLLAAIGARGATRHELAAQLQLPLTTVCGRVNELKKMGEVTESGERRPTEHGKTATVVVYVAKDANDGHR